MSTINWRLSTTTYLEWRYLMDQVYELDPNTDEAYELREQIRSLPGFPHGYDEDRDTITVDVIDAGGSYSIPSISLGVTVH